MAKLKLTDEWWTAPAEGEDGSLILVTGRKNMEEFMATGKYIYRAEITWKYEGDDRKLPDFKTSSLMEEVQDALQEDFMKDPVAVLTGIYTGCNERNWVFYTRSVNIFQKKLNEDLAKFDVLPISVVVEEDEDWSEYKEMKAETEIDDGE